MSAVRSLSGETGHGADIVKPTRMTRLGRWLRPGWLPVVKVNLAYFENPIFLDLRRVGGPTMRV